MSEAEVYYNPGGKNPKGEIETPHLTGKLHFLIRCSVCHYGLCKEMTILKSPYSHQNIILINPCPRCLEAAAAGEPVEVIPLNNDYQGRQP